MKTTIRKISVWQTSDGEVFKNQDDAYLHQNKVAFGERIISFVEKSFPSYSCENKSDIVKVLTEHGIEIVEAYEKTRCL